LWLEDTLAPLRTEVDFLKYVSRAVNHEIVDLSRNLTAGRRDYRRLEAFLDADAHPIATQADPVRLVCAAEELARIKAQLSPVDREVLDLWLSGTSWIHIAAQFAIGVETVRKRFHRALDAIRENAEFGMGTAE
jgi:DNA-directed RNA polymerase specialized sigma24 family protein